MKRFILVATLAIAALTGGAQTANAQSWLDRLGSAASSIFGGKDGGTVDKLADVAQRLLGADELTPQRVQGTWTYTKPYVAFESENVLSNIGGMAASAKIEKALEGLLTRVGFTAGKMQFTLEADSVGYFTTTSGRKVQFTWRVEKTELAIKFPTSTKEIRMNAKRTGGSLQLAIKADKLLSIATAISDKVATASATAQGINALVKDVKGLYIGLKFEIKQ